MTLWIHLGLIFAGLAGFLTSVTCAMLYLFQSAQLKSRHPGNVFLRLPSLGTLDKIHTVSLAWGVVLFSLGILSGLFWATDKSELGRAFKDPRVLWSLVACVLYWLILSLRLSSLRRGQKIALGTVLIFIFLFFAIMSSHRGF